MTNTIEILKKIKVDAVYGKKKHFNAADRKHNYNLCLGIPNLILNIISGSILFYVLTDGIDSWIKYIPLILTLIIAILGGIQTFNNYEKKIEGHKRVGNKYLAIMKKCIRLDSYIKDNAISNDKLIEEIEILSKQIDETNVEAEAFPTNQNDYLKAKKGIENGEESYTIEELSI
ncbi:SLATT domain-containing protein [Chryseobacterium sp.]|uniref:SLATT domain-containing protein n=1 Tax=Chryseobacterium sp. TaxID=1871047 RepID=UPI0012A902CB|nr:SLATT domain-containing protein [Chryseobacterium sp.]QFG53332.1 SLATT domain-containing protein [Chryseobacterium sp.]